MADRKLLTGELDILHEELDILDEQIVENGKARNEIIDKIRELRNGPIRPLKDLDHLDKRCKEAYCATYNDRLPDEIYRNIKRSYASYAHQRGNNPKSSASIEQFYQHCSHLRYISSLLSHVGLAEAEFWRSQIERYENMMYSLVKEIGSRTEQEYVEFLYRWKQSDEPKRRRSERLKNKSP